MRRLFFVLITITNFAWAQVVSDNAKEARWASFIEDGLMDGDVVWLKKWRSRVLDDFDRV